jgi:NitT/TauT family transport system substrate-binding protein
LWCSQYRIRKLARLRHSQGRRAALETENPLRVPVICLAPVYLAEELLRMEGFTSEYVDIPNTRDMEVLASGAADFASLGIESFIGVDAGKPVVAWRVFTRAAWNFAKDGSAIRDLKGKPYPSAESAAGHVYRQPAAYVGMDPERDINWSHGKTAESMRLPVEGKPTRFLRARRGHRIRARKIGK